MNVILPGSTIGILGGGQLGRMTAIAARSLGYRVQVMDPNPSCPARFVVDACFEGSWDDVHAAKNLARGSDVVTLEIEQVSLACLEMAARYAPVRPGAALMRIVQDRILQKTWLRDHGHPVGEFYVAETAAELLEGVRKLAGSCFVKSAQGGYDGRGQAKVNCGSDTQSLEEAAAESWNAVGKTSCIVERAINLEREISVLVARSPGGEIKTFPSAWNHHENQILAWSVIPSAVPEELEIKAQKIATGIAMQLELEGLLAVELFVTRTGHLLVNEMAPRPHNSYHASEQACVTSQFEQAVRAVCNLPLGDVSVLKPAAIANLLGDLWLNRPHDTSGPRFDRALRVPGVSLYLYEKHTPRPGRKMGHLSAIANTPEEAVHRVLEAQKLL